MTVLFNVISYFNQAWYTPLIPALGNRDRWSSEFETSLAYRVFQNSQGYTVRPFLNRYYFITQSFIMNCSFLFLKRQAL